jgi:hypothetical protein
VCCYYLCYSHMSSLTRETIKLANTWRSTSMGWLSRMVKHRISYGGGLIFVWFYVWMFDIHAGMFFKAHGNAPTFLYLMSQNRPKVNYFRKIEETYIIVEKTTRNLNLMFCKVKNTNWIKGKRKSFLGI